MALLAITFWLLFGGIRLFQKYLGRPTNTTLLEYQRGVLYKKGQPVRDVGPGRIRVWAGVEKLIFLDIRAVPVSFENRAVALNDGATCLYGFSGTVEIQNARTALYSAQNSNQIPPYVFLCCSRLVLNGCSSEQVRINQRSIEDEIVRVAKPRLEAHGFEFRAFRVTQLSIAAPAPQPAGKIPVSSLN